MQTDLVNIGLGFLEGFALIISPCILPILPIILAGSLVGSKKRPLGIIFGFIIIFALFTFFSRKLVQYAGIDLNEVRHISYVILLLFGIIMLSTYLTEKFSLLTSRLASAGSKFDAINNPQGGFFSGLLFGGLVAIIWTPCAGPILAAVIVQTVIQHTTLMSFLTVLAFGIGAAVPMLFIAIFGRKIMTRLGFFKTHAVLCRKIIGVIVIASVGYMFYLEGGVATSFAATTTNKAATSLQNGLAAPYPAPKIAGISAWFNSAPLQLNELKGKVVLIDFWTYSCINCVRTLPYTKGWYNKYHDKGLVIIGMHTPEFDFEKDATNVKNAVIKEGIPYPVALDSQFVTWQNFNNSYWPALYLIDKSGNVVYQHFGEGDDDITENNIRFLLGIDQPVSNTAGAQQAMAIDETPETYLGYARAARFASPETVAVNQTVQYTFPTELAKNDWALQGAWKVMADRAIAMAPNSAIKIHFNAHKVFIVMGSAAQHPINVKLVLNGKFNSSINVNAHTLYAAIALNNSDGGILQVVPSEPGLEVYTFTFGD